MPFAYFSSFGESNGYNRYFYQFHDSDCCLLQVWPYAESLDPSPHYLNPGTFQVISAGQDKTFGPGTSLPGGRTWSPSRPWAIDPRGRDDLSNFFGGYFPG